MILWLTGNTGAGKTTLSRKFKNWIFLDGDELRDIYPTGLSKEDRWKHNIRVAKLAKLFENQGFAVVVSVICPYEELRREVQEICGCTFLYVPGGKSGPDYPYEIPNHGSKSIFPL